jgi:hypothetical protein
LSRRSPERMAVASIATVRTFRTGAMIRDRLIVIKAR